MPIKKHRLAQKRELPRPLTLEQWAKDEVRRERLVELLEDPVMQEAIATLELAYSPSVPNYVASEAVPMPIPSAADVNNLLAMRHVHRAGFFGFLNAMKNLTREKVLRRAEKTPWGDLVPEA